MAEREEFQKRLGLSRELTVKTMNPGEGPVDLFPIPFRDEPLHKPFFPLNLDSEILQLWGGTGCQTPLKKVSRRCQDGVSKEGQDSVSFLRMACLKIGRGSF